MQNIKAADQLMVHAILFSALLSFDMLKGAFERMDSTRDGCGEVAEIAF